MKYLMIICLALSLSLTACEEECHLIDKPAACSDIAPTDENCLAYFERWFYDESTNSCSKVGYSGCNQVGFETEEDCLSCACND